MMLRQATFRGVCFAAARVPSKIPRFEVSMLDCLYVAIVIAFFVLLWSFTKASERL